MMSTSTYLARPCGYVTLVSKRSTFSKEVHQFEKQMLQQEQAIRRKASQRHALLHECKVNVVDLPLLQGSLDRLVVVDELITDESQANGASQHATGSQHSQGQLAIDGRRDCRRLQNAQLEDEAPPRGRNRNGAARDATEEARRRGRGQVFKAAGTDQRRRKAVSTVHERRRGSRCAS